MSAVGLPQPSDAATAVSGSVPRSLSLYRFSVISSAPQQLVPEQQLASFAPDVLNYHALLPKGDAKVEAIANDRAAGVRVEQTSRQAKVIVTNGDATSVYTVDFDTPIRGSDEFTAAQLGSQWHWVRPDSEKWRLANGSLVITSQSGDLQEAVNTALAEFVSRRQRLRILDLAGKIAFDPKWDYKKMRRRRA